MKQFSEKTRREVVRAHIQDGRTLGSLAAEYGVSKATISNWVRAYREECQNNESEMSQLELMEEVRRLRQEKAELEKENLFLKKAAAFFAKEID
jgi:Transposase.